ncbi:MAG: SurA N-terminal domain-containing protein [Nanobdellota archaeon]
MKRILLMMVLVLLVAGCQSNGQQTAPTGESINNKGLDTNQDESAVAEVNGEKIYQSEVDQVKQITQQQGQQADDSMIVEQLVQQELLLQEAENKGLSVTTEETEEYLKENLQGEMTLEDLKAQAGDQYNQLIEQQKEQVLIQKLLDEVDGNTSVSQEELEKFYESNKQMMGNTTLEEAESQLRAMLEQQKQQQIITELVEKLEQKADIRIDENMQQQEQPQEQAIQIE